MHRVLLADPQQLLRRGLRSVLEGCEGFEVCGEADTAQDAVRAARESAPDVCVLGMTLPELSGADAARDIARQLDPARVLFVGAAGAHRVITRLLATTPSGFLLLSDTCEEFLAAITAVGDGRQYVSVRA